MKLCIIITGLNLGGAEKHLLKISPYLPEGTTIISLTKEGKLKKEFPEKITIKDYNIKNFYSFFEILKYIKKKEFTHLDTYCIHANILGRLIKSFNKKIILINSVRNDYRDHKILTLINKITKNKVNLWVINNKYLKETIPENSCTVYLPNCINKTHFKKVKENKTIVIAPHRFIKIKNIELIINSMKGLEDTHELWIFGNENSKNYNYFKLISPKNVIFHERSKDISKYYSKSDIYVNVSSKEGTSNATLEAIHYNLKIIVSDIPQNNFIPKENRIPINEKVLHEKILNWESIPDVKIKINSCEETARDYIKIIENIIKQRFNEESEKWIKPKKSNIIDLERKIRKRETLEKLGNVKNKKILDIGCGAGYNLKDISKKNTIVGLDISEKMLKLAKKENHYKKITLADINQEFPKFNEKFDYIIMLGVDGYLIKPEEKIIQIIQNYLKKEGKFIFTIGSINSKSRLIRQSISKYLGMNSYFIGTDITKLEKLLQSKKYTYNKKGIIYGIGLLKGLPKLENFIFSKIFNEKDALAHLFEVKK